MVTRRRTGFQDSPDFDEVPSQVIDDEVVETVTDEIPPTPPEPQLETVIITEEPKPKPMPEQVAPPRLLEKPIMPERRRNIPRFSRIKP